MSTEVFIVAASRTPVGSFQGALSTVPAPTLGAVAIKSVLAQSRWSSDSIDQCIMGQVLSAGTGQAPARQAALNAGLSEKTVCMTINKVCGSGLKAVMLGSDAIQLGHSDAVVAGGQENMTLAPHLLMQSRQGYRMGHQKIIDSMILDGLWDPYNDYHMGNAAELCVEKYKFSREEQDAFAIVSYQRAQRAQDNGYFRNEICSVTVEERGGPRIIAQDEEPTRVNFEKISTLRPAFDSKGTITAANASKINDGAAAILLASKNRMEKMGSKPLAKIVSQATWAQAPSWFTTAPIGAIQEALRKAQLSVDDIDLWEINEAFANVAMAAIKELSLPHEKVNIHGGAIALGHPIGGSGARILTTLVHSLHTHNKRYGLATLCIGGGEAVAIIIERT